MRIDCQSGFRVYPVRSTVLVCWTNKGFGTADLIGSARGGGRQLVDDWVTRGGGVALDPFSEAEDFFDFAAARLEDPSHALTICRMEQAALRAGDAALTFTAPDRRVVDDAGPWFVAEKARGWCGFLLARPSWHASRREPASGTRRPKPANTICARHRRVVPPCNRGRNYVLGKASGASHRCSGDAGRISASADWRDARYRTIDLRQSTLGPPLVCG